VKYPIKTEAGNIIVDVLIAVTIFAILVAAAAPSFEWSENTKSRGHTFEKNAQNGKK